MKYIMQQKMVSIGNDFWIKDQNGQNVFFVDGYGFSFGKRFSFQTSMKQELYDVRQKLGRLAPTFYIYKNKEVVAKVHRSLFAFRNVFYLKLNNDLRKVKIVGKLIEHNYRFIEDGKTVCSVDKKWLRNTDTYSIDINTNIQPAIILSAAVVIDLICHDDKSKHNR